MPLSSRTLLLSILSASAATAHAGWAHGWRDQYIRVSTYSAPALLPAPVDVHMHE